MAKASLTCEGSKTSDCVLLHSSLWLLARKSHALWKNSAHMVDLNGNKMSFVR